jgi:hypothetical protein
VTTVFVVSEPLRKDEAGHWVRTHDLTDARRFGELRFLLPPGDQAPQDPRALIKSLEEGLRHFTSADFLLPIGHPAYVAWAAAVAARRCGGRLSLLHWNRRLRRYDPLRADCYPELTA